MIATAYRKTIHDLLREARSRFRRLSPAAAHRATRRGALIVDIRPAEQRRRDGLVPGALALPRNALEWLLDPESPHQHPEVGGLERRIILLCAEGYQSSLACATLVEMGFLRATDVAGGFAAWKRAGLPVRRALALQ